MDLTTQKFVFRNVLNPQYSTQKLLNATAPMVNTSWVQVAARVACYNNGTKSRKNVSVSQIPQQLMDNALLAVRILNSILKQELVNVIQDILVMVLSAGL